MENDYERVSSDYNEFLEAICSEPFGKSTADGIIAKQSDYSGTEIYIAEFSRNIYTNPEYRDFIFPCSLWRGKDKIAIGEISLNDDGNYVLSNLAFGGGLKIKTGDRIIFEEPVNPKAKK